jgi:hypothetical protein
MNAKGFAVNKGLFPKSAFVYLLIHTVKEVENLFRCKAQPDKTCLIKIFFDPFHLVKETSKSHHLSKKIQRIIFESTL